MIKAGSILRRLAAREMKRNRLQFLSMIIITMLAVTLFCGFVSQYENAGKSGKRILQRNEPLRSLRANGNDRRGGEGVFFRA